MASLLKDRDVGILIIRLGFGLGFAFLHGIDWLSGGPEVWAQTGAVVGHLGIDFGHTELGFIHAVTEFTCGLLIAAGLFFRPAAGLLFLVMTLATLGQIAEDSPVAHPIKNAALFLGLTFLHPGKYSVDAWIERRKSGGKA